MSDLTQLERFAYNKNEQFNSKSKPKHYNNLPTKKRAIVSYFNQMNYSYHQKMYQRAIAKRERFIFS